MKFFSIVIQNNKVSESGYQNLLNSSNAIGNNFLIQKLDAVTPATKDKWLLELDLVWNYPFDKEVFDDTTGLIKTPYSAKDHNKKIACALSHYLLWKKCVDINEPILILEHDAYFVQKLDTEKLLQSEYQIIGINDPIGATRKAKLFDSIISKDSREIQPVPVIDLKIIPQGLAGASAYLVKPEGCKKVLEKVKEVGLWHNDALLCWQLFDFLAVTKTYYTRIQNLESTTTR